MSEVVLVVEDQRPMQERLLRILRMLGYVDSSIFCAADVAQAKTVGNRHSLGMVLINHALPDGDGVELIGWLRSKSRSLPILVISAWNVETIVLDVLKAGASGYLLKERDDLEIAMSLRNVSMGGTPIDPFVARRILDLVNDSDNGNAASKQEVGGNIPVGTLSKREMAVLTHVVHGMSNRQIAETLNVSPWTVDTHVRHIYSKLSVNSRTQAVQAARLQGLIH